MHTSSAHIMPSFATVSYAQIQQRQHRTKEVAWNLQQRVRQELAHPAIVHFYAWLLQGPAKRFGLGVVAASTG